MKSKFMQRLGLLIATLFTLNSLPVALTTPMMFIR
jgi:hypothetical protein